MRYLIAFIIYTLLLPLLAVGQDRNADLLGLRVDVVYLASDYLKGRETGKEGEELAARYMAHRFEEIGLEPGGTGGSWFQSFDFQFKPNPHGSGEGESRTGKNVLAFLDNGAPSTVIIGAHYDHLGLGGFNSLYEGEAAVHNGADDNASGVAVMLRLAEELKKGEATNNNYLFIGFSGEELGLYGSKYFVEQPTLDLEQVNYMINMDMVGRLSADKTLVINGVGTSPVWKEVLPGITVGGIRQKNTDSGVGASDHTSFYLKDIPVLHFFTGVHDHYHKPEDDARTINFVGMLQVSDFILELIERLDERGALEFTPTKNEQRQAAKFKVTLGVMPDYTFGGDGMRIDSVLDDRPADQAGIQDGDVVIRIGDTQVDDIYKYMEGLAKYEKGDQTIVLVKRGEETLEFTVTF